MEVEREKERWSEDACPLSGDTIHAEGCRQIPMTICFFEKKKKKEKKYISIDRKKDTHLHLCTRPC